jgi:hypothetical protein
MPRDRIEEILRRRSRQHSHGQRFDQFNRRMYPIMKATLELPRCTQMSRASKAELMRYFPIATVGALEGYFRALYADLINAGDPYAERAQSFPGIKRLDAITSEAKARKVSTGDLIAHQLRHNCFADVCDNLTTLLGADFLSLLRSPPVAAIGFMGWGRDYFLTLLVSCAACLISAMSSATNWRRRLSSPQSKSSSSPDAVCSLP